jgi:hypothetical protein
MDSMGRKPPLKECQRGGGHVRKAGSGETRSGPLPVRPGGALWIPGGP